jgi:signal transduction histidine kinase
MKTLPSVGLLGRIFLILALVLGTEFLANTFLFDRASQLALAEDEARRMGEHLVVARRVLDRTTPVERHSRARELSTNNFALKWSSMNTAARRPPAPAHYNLETLRDQIMHFEPDLLQAQARFQLRSLRDGGGITGTMELSDHSLVTFYSSQDTAIWPITFGRVLTLLAPTLVLLIVGGFMVRATLTPLRALIRQTTHIGTDNAKPMTESGPGEIRGLISAFNSMQNRIHRLITTRTQALAAVGHDLRTPLARLQLRLERARVDPDSHRAMAQDISEMTDLLHSLQIYLSGEGATIAPERVDLAAMAATLIDSARDTGQDAFYFGPARLDIIVRPVPIRRALSNLVDNALHYGGNARLSLQCDESSTIIAIDDDGPGIPEDRIADTLQPFVRLDGARTRNTRGMGLGLTIALDAVRAEGGTLTLSNRPEGGLRATLTLPRALT